MVNTNLAIKENLITRKDGFTLIELLVVFAVIGILAAIAIPQFYSYRGRAVDTQMKSDIKNVALAMESYYSEKFVYPSTIAEITPFGFRQTQGVNLVINITAPLTYTVTASKPAGTQPSFTYDSNTGQTY
jgi:type IV pilus assembly protein PilA